jgi:AcrR family transcriptional regulator
MTKTDRRVQRTRELLQNALLELISERGYDAVTIQDIADRANVARTTFYVHYSSKDDLLVSCHEIMVRQFQSGLLHRLSREELLSPDTPSGMIAAYRHLEEARTRIFPMFQGKDGALILRRIRDWSAQQIESNLRAVFDETDCGIPLDLLATYLASAQITLMHWWLEKRQPHTPETLAKVLHRLQRAAIRDAFELGNGE